jgi:alkylation response protein AidB-like acyl-CoA dehydrogenase
MKMDIGLTSQHENNRLAFREFVEREIKPHANQFDRDGYMPATVIRKLAEQRWLGAAIPTEWGGGGLDTISYGLLHEEIGRGCSSLRSMLTVHDMVARAILKWGTNLQRERWLTKLSDGQVIAAFGLSEPNVGSDAQHVETSATFAGGSYVLNGRKKWITSGQVADLFLVLAHCEGKPSAFLIEKETPGLTIEPIRELLGLRASMLSSLALNDCRVPQDSLVGKVGFGFSHVVSSALHHGRYGVAWGCVGIAQACLEACLQYTNERKQFGSLLKDHQLIRRLITDMMTNLKAARLLCIQAGYSQDDGAQSAFMDTMMAKYFASRVATKAAAAAVQIHGANGCGADYPVARFFRDAKIMEIIEGSNEIQQLTIAEYGSYGF